MCTITRSKMLFKIGVLKKFANFTETRLRWSFFLILQDRCFPVKFAKFAEEHLFLQNISGGYFYMWPPSKIAAPRQNMEIKKWFLTIERTYNISYHSKEHINIFFLQKNIAIVSVSSKSIFYWVIAVLSKCLVLFSTFHFVQNKAFKLPLRTRWNSQSLL